MKLTIDFEKKTITIDGECTVEDLVEKLKQFEGYSIKQVEKVVYYPQYTPIETGKEPWWKDHFKYSAQVMTPGVTFTNTDSTGK